jgi:hypothetical protein
MSYETACMPEIGQLGDLDSAGSWVREVLEPDQLTESKMRYGPRKLSRGTLLLLWALRVYVVFMLIIIGLAVWNSLHAAG